MNQNPSRQSAPIQGAKSQFARQILFSVTAICLFLTSSPDADAQVGGDDPVPNGAFFNGVFPSDAPGSVSGFTTVNAFPNLRFIGPIWVTPYPGTNDLVVVGKSGHVWRFDNDPDTMPGDVTVMLNISKYGDGVDLPANVLPDGSNEPSVVNTPYVPSAPDMAFYNLTFHPNFGQAGQVGENYVYTSYSYLPSDLPGANNDQFTYFRVTRFTVINDPTDGPVLDPSSETVLIQQFDRDRNHQGGAMFFGDDGFLYISTGDGGFFYSNGTSERISQRLEGALMGGILRIDVDMQGGGVSHAIPQQPDDSVMKHDGQIPAGWPASYSANYMIPNDNPWVGTGGILEEFWAVGLRSPHSMARDGVTGEIWIGDVGGNAEEIHLAAAGDNFGWDYTNGGGEPQPSPLIGTNEPAILTIPRTVGTCVIGGHIYRGTEFPSLVGKLIYGDHVKGTVSSLDYTMGQPVVNEFLCDFPNIGTKAGLSNICPGPNNEVFMTDLGGFDDGTDIEDNDGTIQRLASVNLGEDPPSLLSQTGAFLDLATLTPHPAFIPYDVLSPLWSDNARKDRWIALPNDGSHDTAAEKITFSDKDNWIFPEGTVLMKHFELPNDETDPTSTVRLETRFIICTTGGGKYGFTYRWLPDQSDATLLATGETGDYQIAEVGGGSRTQTWQFPSRSDCLQCHNSASGQALGVRTNQLNGFFTDPSTGIKKNQLLEWSRLGMFDVSLTAAEVADFIQSLPLDYTDAPIEHRVRSYMDSNCSHCHRPAGPGGNFDARLSTNLLSQGIINEEPDMFQALDPDGLYIKPMDVANSIIHFRMDHALPSLAAMPPLAKNVVDDEAVQAVAEWINTLNPADFPATPLNVRALLGGPASTTGDINVTIILDDDVSDLTISDLQVTNGTILELTGSCHYYTAVIRPTGSPVGIDLPAGRVTGDNTLVTNSASNSLIVPFTDSEAPVAEFIALPISGEITGTTNIGIDFGKDVSGFTAGDLSASNAAISNVSGSNGIHYFDITPFGPGDIVIDLAANAVLDSQSRSNAAASITLSSVLLDTDEDGLPDIDETTHGTNPNLADSDNDGLTDGAEVNIHGTNPNLADSDSDGIKDGTEVYVGSDPLSDSSLPPYTAPDSLVTYYNFDEQSGTVAHDTALNGTAEDATRVQGTVLWDTAAPLIGGAALDLNGATSLDSVTPFDGSTTGFTISVWLKSDSFSTTREGIINHRNNSNSNMWGIAVVPATGGSDYRINTSNGGVSVPDGTFVTGQWQHVAFTWDGIAQTASVWVDGVLLSTATGVASTFTGFDNPWKIGDDPCCGGREMNGRLDDMAFFSEVLSPSQIGQIHGAGLLGLPVINAFQPEAFAAEAVQATPTVSGIDPTSLVSYYSFDEGAGSTAADTATSGTAETASEAQGSLAWETGSPFLGSAAINLDGSTSLNAVTPLDTSSTEYTISVWIRPDTLSPHRMGIYNHRGSTVGEFWGASTESSGGIDNRIGGEKGASPVGSLSTGSWQHVAVTWNAFGNTAGAPGLRGVSRTYVNGVLTSTLTNVSSAFNATANPWTIGDDTCCNDREFDGRMDDLGVFSKELSASDIGAIHQAGLSGSTLPEVIQAIPMTVSSSNVGNIVLSWVSETGSTYSILTSSDLSLPPEEWTILYNNVVSQGIRTTHVTPFNPSTSSENRRFFRIMRN